MLGREHGIVYFYDDGIEYDTCMVWFSISVRSGLARIDFLHCGGLFDMNVFKVVYATADPFSKSTHIKWNGMEVYT